MGCVALVRCVLVLRCGSAGVVWYPDAFLFHYLMLNMFRMLTHPSSGVCDLFIELFYGLCCSGSMCVGVTVWLGCGGVVSGCRYPDTTPPQPNHTVKPTHIFPEQYNP